MAIDKPTSGAVTWLVAGQGILRSGGIRAVKLHALAKATGLTTGSFYHHFEGMPQYLEELAAFYGSDQINRSLARLVVDDPRQRIRRVAESAIDNDMISLDVAMRDWAGSSPAAAQAVEAADRILLEFLATAFEDIGFEQRDGQLRAQLLLSGGVARVIPPWDTHDIDDLLAILAP